MNNTGQTTSDIFNNDYLQLNIDEEVIAISSNTDRYSGIYKEFAELLGDAATLKIWKRFSGLNVTFPQKLYSEAYRKDYIKNNMDKIKTAELAKNVGLSERRIRQIIKEMREK
jgi:hypothetical protein